MQTAQTMLTASIVLAPPAFFAGGFFPPGQNEPKKPSSFCFRSESRSRPLLSVPGGSLPVLGSITAGGGFDAFMRSLTIAIALWPLMKSGCPVLMYVDSILL